MYARKFYWKLVLLFFVAFHLQHVEGEWSGERKCKKRTDFVQDRCIMKNAKSQKKLSQDVNEAIRKGVVYLKTKLETFDHVSAWISQSIALTGLHLEAGTCKRATSIVTPQISLTTNQLETMPGGKLAMVLVGMQATCSFKTPKEQHALSLALKRKMKAFPEGEFNNFFQYSLAVIALYNNAEHIPYELSKTLLRSVFHQKQVHSSVDTKAVALMAVQAIAAQKFNSHWVRKHAQRVLKKAKKRFSQKLNNEENFISKILLAQVFDFKQEEYCQNIIEKIMSQQKTDGSFGYLLTTSWAIEALSGHSVLDLKGVKCIKAR